MALNTQILFAFLLAGNTFAFLHEIKTENLTLKLSDGINIGLDETRVPGWAFVNSDRTLISTQHHTLTLECKSSFPIKWNITGYLSRQDMLGVRPYKRTFITNKTFTFHIKSSINFAFDPKISAGAVTVACERSDSNHDAISVDVFVPNANRKMLFANTTNNPTLQDTNIIPCAITDPGETVTLHKDGKQVYTQEMNLQYNPMFGFTTVSFFPTGNYTCKADEAEQSFGVTRSELPADFIIDPKTEKIKTFSSTGMDIRCSAKDSLAKTRLQTDFPLRLKEKNGSTQVYALESDIKLHTVVQGNVYCITDEKKVIWKWEISFVDEPTLFLDNFAGEVKCLSHTRADSSNITRAVSTINCKSEDECTYLEHCFSNYESCNEGWQTQYFSRDQNYCETPGYKSTTKCSVVPFSHSKGIIECNVFGLAKRFMFHNSLGPQKYELKNHKNYPNMLRMQDVKNVLYANITALFVCEGVAFLYADSIVFEILFKNGTSTFMLETSNDQDTSGLIVFGENVIGSLSVNLSVDAIGIRCNAPLKYSSDYDTVEKRFVTKYLLKPQMQQEDQNISITSERRRLNCSAVAEPPATYRWRKNHESLSNGHLYLITTGHFGESLLEFLEVDDNILGQYICEASNLLLNSPSDEFNNLETLNQTSSAWTTFTIVEAKSGKGSSKTILLVSITAGICGIVCLLALACAQRYRRNAYLMLRNLTDAEIEDFFNGSMSFGESKVDAELDGQILPHLPYDKKYEINISEIDLERTVLLGQGNFSVVLKGHWKSSGSYVAVKMSKSTADVVVFKAFLAEIKIMIYIGKHDNILRLLGASTDNIKDRQLHMVFELCEFGSLQDYLLAKKDTFINLFDEKNSENLQRSLEPSPDHHVNYQNTGQQISTKDLVQWCDQIGCAMEHLCIKNIVHGDLAARNVLLSSSLTCKVADFGLSKQLYDNQAYTKQAKLPLPWRWMALESLQSLTFSTQSDIWSFGVTMWEIFSLGNVPYANDIWNSEFVERLSNGMRIGRPKFANHEVYANIAACWDEAPYLRPPFSKQRKFFMDLTRRLDKSKIKNVENNYS